MEEKIPKRQFAIYFFVVSFIFAASSMAATVNWKGFQGGVEIRADRTSLSAGECRTFEFTATDNAPHIFVGGRAVTWQCEDDIGGTASGAVVSLSACTRSDGDGNGVDDALACSALNFRDTDSDGVGDANTMDCVSAGQRGILTPINIAGYLYVDATTAPTAGTAEFVVCAEV